MPKKRPNNDQEWEETGRQISNGEHRALWNAQNLERKERRQDIRDLREVAESRFRWLVAMQMTSIFALLGLIIERLT